MEEAYPAANRQPEVTECLSAADEAVLEGAIVKLVFLGRQVGVSPDEMIQLLESGLTVRELLEFLAAQKLGS